MRFLLNVVLFLAVAAAFIWWLRPYWGRWQRAYRSARGAFKFVKQVRDATKNGRGFSVGGTADYAKAAPKTVDVTAKMSLKVGCPICQEMLSEAQVQALRSQAIRCPAMQQRGADCPYYARSLN